jgi:HlyD family secretion protein
VTVDAYPNRPFEGSVLKIEPQADTAQNVTRFPVRVRIQNRDNLLRPGMNTEVQIHVGRRDSVLAVPTAALRTQRDVASAAQVVGVTMEQVQKELAAGGNTAGGDAAGGAAAGRGGRASLGATTPTDSAGNGAKAGNTMTTPDGRTIPLPEGVTEAQVRAIFQKRMSGGELTADEQATLTKVRQAMGRGGAAAGGGRARGGSEFQFGGNYIAFVRRNGAVHAVNVRTGLTDLDYSEVRSGLQPGDSVLMLPSASLMQSQTEMKQRINSITGGGMPGMRQQTPSSGGGR